MKKQAFKANGNQNGNVATAEKAQGADLKIVGNAEEKPTTEETAKEVKPTEEPLKEQIQSMIEKFKPEPIKTAEGRIEAVKQFDALSKRFATLKQKSNDLKTFEAGNDKTNALIIFQNQQGFKFEVQNSNVIKKLVEAAQNELSILLNEAESEVLTFEI